MSLLSEYKSSLKSVEVEEPIDLALHRPLAFVVAKAALRTPLTPNQLTVVSMLLGVLGGASLYLSSAGRFFGAPLLVGHLAGAALLFWSAVVDCSDGMLARMRRTSSELGRMLDGVADLVTMAAVTFGSVAVIFQLYPGRTSMAAAVVLAALTVYTSQFHTSGYDFYKNVYLRMTVPQNHEGEDVEHAEERWEKAKERPMSLVMSISYHTYVGYLRGQRKFIGWFDPHAVVRLSSLPAMSPERAEVYRRHHAPLMLVWRSLFGVGSLMFGFVVANAFGRPDLFLLFRLVVLNGVFFLYLMPAQRRASRLANEELGIPTGIGRGGRPIQGVA
jgi:phosphatidylglycerophosphate synthase